MWQTLGNDALRLYLALKDLTTNDETPMTLEGVCDAYGIPRSRALSTVQELVDKGVATKGSGTLKLAGEKRSVKFVKAKPERIDTAEQEIVRLKGMLKARVLGETSGLADPLPPEERLFVIELERDMKRGVSVGEAFLLGKCIQGWGIPRTKQLIKQKWDSDNPILTAYAMLTNGARGKKFEKTQPRAIKYRERERV